ncbi:hypothetical protein GCM10010415_76060 [Streptomyces atrovirens]
MTAGVTESEGGESFTLEFQCGFEEPDAQNIRNGCSSYCVATPDQGTAYGCVRTVELEGDILRVTFDPDSLEALFLDDPVVEAVLHAPAADIARMREALTRILTYGRPDAIPIGSELRLLITLRWSLPRPLRLRRPRALLEVAVMTSPLTPDAHIGNRETFSAFPARLRTDYAATANSGRT